MRNIWSTFKFELKNQLKKKSFWISSIIMVLLVLALTSLPTILGLSASDESVDEAEGSGEVQELPPDVDLGKYVADDSIDQEILSQIFPFAAMEQVDSEEALKQDLMDETIPVGIVFENEDMRAVVKSENMSTDVRMYAEGFVDYKNQKLLADEGVSPDIYQKMVGEPNPPVVESLEKSALQNFFIAYIGVFLLYMIIMLYGSSTATMIATEKSNRTMEVLITSTNPTTLVIGKVLAGLVTALIQILILGAAIVIGLTINKGSYPASILAMIQESITPELFLVFTVFSIVGFALYLFIFATSGALVSKIEDINKALVPINAITIISFFVAFFSLYGSSDSALLKVTSYIPFTSPYAMFIRYSAFGVSTSELLLSLGILLLSTAVVAFICIKIYRSATLNYGNSVSFLKGAKDAFSKDK